MTAEALTLLRALHDCERAAAEGLPADRAVARAVAVFHVNPAEVRRVWLEKTIACQQARFSREADK